MSFETKVNSCQLILRNIKILKKVNKHSDLPGSANMLTLLTANNIFSTTIQVLADLCF